MVKTPTNVYSYTYSQSSYRKAMWTYFIVTLVLFIVRVSLLYVFGQDFRVTPLNALLFTGHVLTIGLMLQLGRVKKRSVDITHALEKSHQQV